MKRESDLPRFKGAADFFFFLNYLSARHEAPVREDQ